MRPRLRFSQFEGAWSTAPLNFLTKIYDGTHATPNYVEKGIPFYSVEHLTKDNFSKTKFISEDVFDRENKRVKLERGDVLMTRIGDIGTAKLIDWDVRASFYVSLSLLKVDHRQLFPAFLTQSIRAQRFQRELWQRTIHVAFPKKINLGEIGKCEHQFPSMEEQQKIADFLTSVDTRIQQLKQKQSLLQQYKKGLMQQLFSQTLRFKDDAGHSFPDWEEVWLTDVATVTTGSSNREDSAESGEYVFFDRSNDQRWSDKYLYDCEAIIVAGEGREFPPRLFKGKFDLHQRAYAVTHFERVEPSFMYYQMDFCKRIFLKYAVGSTMPSLRMVCFEKFSLKLPTLDEQMKIANALAAMDKKIDAVGQQIKHTQTFKKGLLQQMFV